MGYLSDTYADAVMDLLFGNTSPTIASNYDVALSTTPPADDGTGVTEPSGGSYARVEIANDTTTWAASASRVKTNNIAVAFPTPTGDWGTVGWFVIYEHGTSTLVGYGELAVPQTITSGSSPPTFQPNTFTIQAPGS